jgi:DNA modification methylase
MRGGVEHDDRVDWREAWSLFPGDVAYIWSSDREAFETVRSVVDAGFAVRSQIIWAKQHFALSRGHYHSQHETCWYAVRRAGTAHWRGDRKQSTLWHITGMNAAGGGARASEDGKTNHGTQKPVECMRRPIENNSSPGQAVYDPFVGSGTTIIAAEMTGRSCHALEISPAYCDVTVSRWQNFTGETATLDGDGRSFAEIKATR